MINSAGMRMRRTWKMILRTGHSFVLASRQERGLRTRVSQAATVRVQTKKYLCADKWVGRLSEGGRRAEMSGVPLIADY
jgi:hypothetical protein